jgi:hypothetical protein
MSACSEILLVGVEIIANTYRSTICKTHVLSLYFLPSIYIVTLLHTVYHNWLLVVLEMNLRCT